MWKISSLNPKYEVNELGQVRHAIKKNILKGYHTKTGYVRFCMYDADMKRHDLYCHVMVATEFIPNPDPEHLTEVNHINFNKDDNNVENLEWVSHDDNMEHWREAQEFYTINELELKVNKNRYQVKVPVAQYSLDGELIKIFPSYTQAGKELGIRDGNISLAARGKRHTAGGYVWRDVLEGSTTIENSNERVEQASSDVEVRDP